MDMVRKTKDESDLKFEQIAVRVKKSLKDAVDLAAKCEGVTTPDWVRAALNYYLLTKTNICPDCGTYNSIDSIFCKKCGNRLPTLQLRLLTKRYGILANFVFQCDFYKQHINQINLLAREKTLTEENLHTYSDGIEALVKSWSDNIPILQNLNEEILQYGIYPEINKALEEQNNLFDHINKTISTYTEDLTICKKLLSELQNSNSKNNLDE